MVKKVKNETGEVSGESLKRGRIVARPLSASHVKIPLVGEQVVCAFLPTGGTEHETQPHGWFYFSTLDVDNSQFHNTDRSHPNYSGGTKRYAKTFSLQDEPTQVPHQEGEISVIGRFGNHIRFLKDQTEIQDQHGFIRFTDKGSENFRIARGSQSTTARVSQVDINTSRIVLNADDVLVPGDLVIANKWKARMDDIVDILEELLDEVGNLASGASVFNIQGESPAGPVTGRTLLSTNTGAIQRIRSKLKGLK